MKNSWMKLLFVKIQILLSKCTMLISVKIFICSYLELLWYVDRDREIVLLLSTVKEFT